MCGRAAGGLAAGGGGVAGGFVFAGFSDFGAGGIASAPGSASVGSVSRIGAVGRGLVLGGAAASAADGFEGTPVFGVVPGCVAVAGLPGCAAPVEAVPPGWLPTGFGLTAGV